MNCFATLVAVALTLSFAACSSDDDDDDWKEGATVELANTRAFILNEGTMGRNNTNIIYFDWSTGTVNSSCIYAQQNGKALGDTGNDIITYGSNILVAVNGSNYLAMLNGSAVEKARLSFADYANLGLIRDVAIGSKGIYASSYGGYVSKISYTDSKFTVQDSIKVGSYPEDVLAYNGKIYCAVSGWGADSRVAVIDESNTKSVSYIDVMVNPNNLVECDGHIFVQGYGPYAADWSCPYPWGEITDGTYKELGYGSTIAAGNGKVFTALSKTDWTTNTTSTTFAVYDIKTGTSSSNFFKNAPESMSSINAYSISINPYNNYIYVASGDGYSEATIHVFDASGNYQSSFAANGLCPNHIIFLKN